MALDIQFGLITLVMTVLGGIISVTAISGKWLRLSALAVFIVLGSWGMVIVVRQSREAASANVKLQGAIEGISTSTAEAARVQQLNTELQEKLLAQSGTIQSLATQAVGQITGGDSYVYLEPIVPAPFRGGLIYANTVMKFVGTYPLPGVHILVVDNNSQKDVFERDYGTVAPVEIGRTRSYPLLSFSEANELQTFGVSINTTNASFGELIRFQKVGTKWLRAFMIERRGGKQLYKWIDPGFPEASIPSNWGAHRK